MPVIRSLLLLTVYWFAVKEDCRHDPESVSHYLLRTFEARIVGTIPQPDGTLAPDYAKSLTIYRVPQTVYGPSGCGAYPCLALPDPVEPAPGEVVLIEDPVAVDYDGNRSDSPCE